MRCLSDESLALNARRAARAGEAGAGFAVVADEVRICHAGAEPRKPQPYENTISRQNGND